MEIAEKIQRLMDERGITPYRLAKETGVSYTGLSKILSQQTKNPQIDSLKAIAAYFGKPVDYFTEEGDFSTPEWATAKDIRDFKRMLEEDSPIMFDGVPLDVESRQRVMDILTGLFWDAKKQNKKTYGRKAKTDTNNKDTE
ncbi:helix-turn-helix domain-containing protein [Cohnella nanjingensis]|uniref:Helix-turn-helix domain-containing protein n=1 Tax=Cohnella nanjingensis TaxID=1387779 RepID=A0A7X0VE11_9BACL|nr:helix-turn-helix domain-containing protein [Cohnella nanjingensis]MBB6670241.1 helix-turn-helix domain-containing protein [Cohnella nanjingensis]